MTDNIRCHPESCLMEEDLEVDEQLGSAVADSLARVTKNRFKVKMPDSKLKTKMAKYLIPENCPELKAPVINEEVLDRGNIDRVAKRNDLRLMQVQKTVAKAAAAVVNVSDQLHKAISSVTSARSQDQSEQFVSIANKTLETNGDVIAMLGAVQQ